MSERKDQVWRELLANAARNRNVFGWEKIEHYYHAMIVLTAIQAFGDDPRATFFMEVRAGRGNIPRPDLILLHPEVGVLVIENKGIKLEEIQGVQNTTVSILREGRFKQEDPFHQAEKVSFRLRDLAAKRVDLSEALFLHTVALPRIAQADFEKRFDIQWPTETLFADAFTNAMEFRRRVVGFSEAKQRDAKRKAKLSKRANDAVRMVLDGKGFLHSPRTIYVENASPTLLGVQIQEMELGLKEATPQQREHGVADMRGQHRLFRGVAGSGKSILLALSAAQTLGRFVMETGDLFGGSVDRSHRKRVLVVCFNRTLVHYLRQRIDDRYGRLTWDKPAEEAMTIVHFERLVKTLESSDKRLSTGLTFEQKDERAKALCQRLGMLDDKAREALGYDAVYVDEAQDLSPNEISLLLNLARKDEKGQQTFIIFYDNAQNIYGVTPPVWEKLGVNILGGRTVFLDQCLRNTTETLSLAFNVLVGSFASEGERVTTRTFADVASLRQRGLVEEKDGRFDVRFSARKGPSPFVRCYASRRAEVEGVADEVRRLVHEQRVVPSDILVLYKSHFAYNDDLVPALEQAVGQGCCVRQVRSDDANSKARPLIEDGTLTISTIASAKGYDAPVVFLLGVDDLATETKGRASFYVGATRAKLALIVSGVQRESRTLLDEVVATATAIGSADCVKGYRAESSKLARATQPRALSDGPRQSPVKHNSGSKSFTCRHCGGARLHAQHGKFGYYFVCIDCAENTPIQSSCPTCGMKEKVRKERLTFFSECKLCGSSRLIHVNASLDSIDRPGPN
jgi:hypothetical protein